MIGAVLLFTLTYVLLSASLERRDRESLEQRLVQLAANYETLGLSGLKKALSVETRLRRSSPFFVRIAASGNLLVFREIPDQWSEFDLTPLEQPASTPPVPLFRLASPDGDQHLEVVATRLSDGTVLQVGKSTEDRDEFLALFVRAVAGAALPLAILGLVGSAFLGMRSLRPIRSLVETVRAIDSGAMATRVPAREAGDELNELALSFNRMLDRIASLIKGMREALDNVAHDLRTPISRIKGVAELALASNASPAACRDALADCLEETEQLRRMLDTLMDISEAETGTLKLHLGSVNVSDILATTGELYRYAAEEKATEISVAADDRLVIWADRCRIRQVVANLLDNAVKYTPGGGHIDIRASRKDGFVVISVTDNGVGIEPDELPRIWDRLYRADRSRSQRGLGLGLSLVKAVVEAHHGKVEAVSAPGSGSRFTITLPAADSA